MNVLAASAACFATHEAPDAGKIVLKDGSACGSPDAYMMQKLLASPDDRRRFLIFQNEYILPKITTSMETLSQETRMALLDQLQLENDNMFYRMDEQQFLNEALDSCVAAYTTLMKTFPEALRVLRSTETKPIRYRGGFRPLTLDTDEQGFGFNIVGKALELVRQQKKMISPKPFTLLVEDRRIIGLIIIAIRALWVPLIQGADDLLRYIGKSAHEILVLTGTPWNDELLMRRSTDADIETGLFYGLSSQDIAYLVEMELRYPGNLAGFLRKIGGYGKYVESIRYNLYQTLWKTLAESVFKKSHPDIPQDMYSVYTNANSAPDVILENGPRLVRAFLGGKIEMNSVEEKNGILYMIDVVHNLHAARDALFFVPRRYVLQTPGFNMEEIVLFDFIDKDERIDMLSPLYIWDKGFVIDGFRFYRVLHYILFRVILRYHPDCDSKTKERLYRMCVYDEPESPKSDAIIGSGIMEERFQEIMNVRRRTLLLEGYHIRLQTTPALLPYLVYGDSSQVSDDEILKEVFDLRDEWFPLLTQFIESCRKEKDDPESVILTIRVWLSVWKNFLTWIKSVVMIYPQRFLRRAENMENAIHIFFDVFYPELSGIVKALPPAISISMDPGALLVDYFVSETLLPGIEPHAPLLRNIFGTYISAYLKGLCLLSSASSDGSSSLAIPHFYHCGESSSIHTTDPLQSSDTKKTRIIKTFGDLLEGLLSQFVVYEWKWDDRFMLFISCFMKKDTLCIERLPPTKIVYYTPNPRDKRRPKKHVIELGIATTVPREPLDKHVLSTIKTFSEKGFLSDARTTGILASFIVLPLFGHINS